MSFEGKRALRPSMDGELKLFRDDPEIELTSVDQIADGFPE